MKKIILIIWSILLFSIPNISLASVRSLEQVLDIQYGPEVFEIEMSQFPKYSFKDAWIQSTYNTYVSDMDLLKGAIIQKYSQDEFTTYQMSWISTSFSSFVYHTNRMFALIKLKEGWNTDKEILKSIKRHYEQSRTSYNQLKNLVYKK